MATLARAEQEDARDLAGILGVLLTPEFWEVVCSASREVIVIGGWRAGKSTVIAFILFLDILLKLSQGRDRLLYWIVGPDYMQTNEEFRYVFEWAQKLEMVDKASIPQEGPRSLSLVGGKVVVETKSAQYHERLGSVAPDGIIVCEAGQVSEETRTMLLGRTMEKTAWIRYAGTLEDDEGHQQWAWYQECATEWMEEPTSGQAAFSNPSWTNAYIFGSCLASIRADPSLARFCADDNHGEAHGGELHPEIQLRRELFDEYTFQRRIAAVPTGVQFQVYPQLQDDRYLLPLPVGKRWLGAAGGIDYGTVHPSTLVVVTLDENRIAWVRECAFRGGSNSGDTSWLHGMKGALSARYNCYRWNTDPNERYMAKSYEAQAVSYSESSRGFRIGLVGTRLDYNGLYYDLNGPGVPELYEEQKRVHRRKQRDGELKLVRLGDDRTAALEDAIEALDGKPLRELPAPAKIQYRNRSVKKRAYRTI